MGNYKTSSPSCNDLNQDWVDCDSKGSIVSLYVKFLFLYYFYFHSLLLFHFSFFRVVENTTTTEIIQSIFSLKNLKSLCGFLFIFHVNIEIIFSVI